MHGFSTLFCSESVHLGQIECKKKVNYRSVMMPVKMPRILTIFCAMNSFHSALSAEKRKTLIIETNHFIVGIDSNAVSTIKHHGNETKCKCISISTTVSLTSDLLIACVVLSFFNTFKLDALSLEHPPPSLPLPLARFLRENRSCWFLGFTDLTCVCVCVDFQ